MQIQYQNQSDKLPEKKYMAIPVKGKPVLLDPLTNKGTAFSILERMELDLNGLLPPAACTMKQQLERTYKTT